MKTNERLQHIRALVEKIHNLPKEITEELIIKPNSEYPKGLNTGEILQGLLALLADREEKTKIEDTKVFTAINYFFNIAKSSIVDKNKISNLVLLDQATNRSYKNAFFPVKRKWIYARERAGVYILPCTKNVFSKSYSQKLTDLMNWTQYDANLYYEEIEKCLSNI